MGDHIRLHNIAIAVTAHINWFQYFFALTFLLQKCYDWLKEWQSSVGCRLLQGALLAHHTLTIINAFNYAVAHQ